MPTCTNCQQEWTWKDVFFRLFTGGDYLTCPYCQSKQFIKKSFKRISNLLFFFMVLLILVGNFYFGPSIWSLIILFMSSGIYFALFPYFITFQQKKKEL